MNSNRQWLCIFLMVLIALSPVLAGAATMGTLSMGAMHSDLHQQMDCGGADIQDELPGSVSSQGDCADMQGADQCCMSCVACALSMTFPLGLEPLSLAFEGHSFNRPRVDLESELRPPRRHSS